MSLPKVAALIPPCARDYFDSGAEKINVKRTEHVAIATCQGELGCQGAIACIYLKDEDGLYRSDTDVDRAVVESLSESCGSREMYEQNSPGPITAVDMSEL